jgi:hypothetical protein
MAHNPSHLLRPKNTVVIWAGGITEQFRDIPEELLYEMLVRLRPWINQYDWNRPMTRDRKGPGYWLRIHRQSRRLTQGALAQMTGLRQAHISEMERGKRPIGKVVAQRLGHVLGSQYTSYL